MSTTRSASLKQGTLSFSNAKRTSSGLKAKPTTTKPPAKTVYFTRRAPSEPDDDIEDFSSSSDESDVPPPISRSGSEADLRDTVEKEDDEEPPRKRRRSAAPVKAKPTPAEVRSREALTQSKVVNALPAGAKLDPKDAAGRWSEHYRTVVKEKMGHMRPIHGEGQYKVHEILRVFDLSVEYGPCVGITRLDRWERANAMGLKPPPEVKEILLTKEGSSEDQYSQSVFHDEV